VIQIGILTDFRHLFYDKGTFSLVQPFKKDPIINHAAPFITGMNDTVISPIGIKVKSEKK